MHTLHHHAASVASAFILAIACQCALGQTSASNVISKPLEQIESLDTFFLVPETSIVADINSRASAAYLAERRRFTSINTGELSDYGFEFKWFDQDRPPRFSGVSALA